MNEGRRIPNNEKTAVWQICVISTLKYFRTVENEQGIPLDKGWRSDDPSALRCSDFPTMYCIRLMRYIHLLQFRCKLVYSLFLKCCDPFTLKEEITLMKRKFDGYMKQGYFFNYPTKQIYSWGDLSCSSFLYEKWRTSILCIPWRTWTRWAKYQRSSYGLFCSIDNPKDGGKCSSGLAEQGASSGIVENYFKSTPRIFNGTVRKSLAIIEGMFQGIILAYYIRVLLKIIPVWLCSLILIGWPIPLVGSN